jgi:hypothetical protein
MKKYPDLGALFKPSVLESTGGWHAYSFGLNLTIAPQKKLKKKFN